MAVLVFHSVSWQKEEFLYFCFGYLMKTYKESNLYRQSGFRPSFLHFSVSKLKLKYLKQLYQFTPKFQIEVECLSMWMPPNMLAFSCKAWEKWWDVRGISVANSKQHHTGIKHAALVTSNSGGLWGAIERLREVATANGKKVGSRLLQGTGSMQGGRSVKPMKSVQASSQRLVVIWWPYCMVTRNDPLKQNDTCEATAVSISLHSKFNKNLNSLNNDKVKRNKETDQ